MKRTGFWFFMGLLFLFAIIISFKQAMGVEKEGAYLLPGNIKAGWKVFTMKGCSTCHAIWGEGGKGGPDLGTLPESYVSPSQLAALMWNHEPEMWGKMSVRKMNPQKIEKKEMADLFAFLYFIRYMDEPGDPNKGKAVIESKACVKCHTVRGGKREDLGRWGMYINPILWAQMMWNHASQMEKEMKKQGLSWIEFKGNEMVDLIAFVRSISPNVEKVYLPPGDPQFGARLFTEKGCAQCHISGGVLDLTKRKDFPRTLAQLAGLMWNHSHQMTKAMEERRMEPPMLNPKEMADLVAYLFSTRYFDEPGDPIRGKAVFEKNQCNLCHAKGTQKLNLTSLKGQISPILMAQMMWNHGPEMLEKMRKAKIPWRKIEGKEMADLMEYLNRGMP